MSINSSSYYQPRTRPETRISLDNASDTSRLGDVVFRFIRKYYDEVPRIRSQTKE